VSRQRSNAVTDGDASSGVWGVRFSQVEPSNCFVRLEKLVLPLIFDTSLSSLMM